MVQIDSSAAMFKGALWKRGIGTVGATHAVVEGIRNLRRMIKDAQGVRLLKVHPRCQYLIYEMGTYRNDPNRRGEKGELIPMKLNDHCLDALRYVAWHLRYE
jgi:phage terminase large subunit